jgi:hypothetical protein
MTAGAAALSPGVQAANSCTDEIGFDTTTAAPTGGGAWAAVSANSGSFLGKKGVLNCEVKVVGTTAKGKPPTSIFLAGPMTQDQCSMYNYLSSVDSKLSATPPKTGEALTVINSMIAKVDTLAATGKLVDPGYTAIGDAADAVQLCIIALP